MAETVAHRAPGTLPRSIADTLRLDWGRDLRWAVPADPWDPGSALRLRATALGLAAAQPTGGGSARPSESKVAGADAAAMAGAVVALLYDTPLLGSLGNLYVAVGAVGLAREAAGALGRPVPVVLCLVPPPGRRADALYAVAADGEIRRITAGAPGRGLQRPGAVYARGLLGAMEEVTRRPWPEADRCLRETAARPDTLLREGLLARWTVRLWAGVFGQHGCLVLHAGLPPLAPALAAAAVELSASPQTLAAEVRACGRRLAALGLAVPDPDGVGLLGRAATVEPGRPAEGAPAPPPGAGAADADPWDAGRPGLGRATLMLALQRCLRPLALIAGDEDVALLVQLSGAVERLAGGRPVLRPRPRWTLITPAQAAFARAHVAPADQGPDALRAARDQAFAAVGAPRVHGRALQLRASLAEHLAGLAREVAATLPRATSGVAARAARLLHGADLLIADLAARQRSTDGATSRAWRYLGSSLYPLGHDQDEWLAAYPWLAEGAEALLRRLWLDPPGPGRRLARWSPGPAAPAPIPPR